jgi:hypothetical protein
MMPIVGLKLMSKQRLENKLIQLRKRMQEAHPNKDNQILYQCLAYNKTPKDKRLKELVRLLEDGIYVGICSGIYPTMPCDAWSKDNGSLCQPEDYKEPIKHLKAEKPSIVKMVQESG